MTPRLELAYSLLSDAKQKENAGEIESSLARLDQALILFEAESKGNRDLWGDAIPFTKGELERMKKLARITEWAMTLLNQTATDAVLQTDLYKKTSFAQEDVWEALYLAEKRGDVSRTKQGRTHLVALTEKGKSK